MQPLRPLAVTDRDRRSIPFLLLFALAWAGGTIGYLPLLSLLLPLKIVTLAGDQRIALVATVAICGAIVASLSNILFGAWSDRAHARGHGRRRFVIGGALATMASYALVAMAQTPAALLAAVMLFQCALNAMLAPLLAIMADEVPDRQKGFAGGLLAMANPLAAGIAAAALALEHEAARYLLVALTMAALLLPFALIRPQPKAEEALWSAPVGWRDVGLAWLARILVQISGVVLALYLLYYALTILPGRDPSILAGQVSLLLLLASVLALPAATLAGGWSDRTGLRKPFLLGSAMVASSGLVVMALARDPLWASAGFIVTVVGSQSFLMLNIVFAMQLLPRPTHRGRDLGLLNLANTLPALIGPALTWWLATPQSFEILLLLLAALTLVGGLVMLGVRSRA